MPNPKLRAKTIRIRRWLEASRQPARSDRRAGYPGDVSYIHTATSVKMSRTLLVEMPSIPRAESKPPLRINLDASQKLDRIVLKGIRGAAADVLSGPNLSDRLEIFINRKVDADTGNYFIRPIEQSRAAALRIAVKNVSHVGREVYRSAQTSIGKHHQSEVAQVSAWTRAALKLIEPLRIFRLV